MKNVSGYLRWKFLWRTLAVILCVVALLIGIGWLCIRASLPTQEATLRLAGLALPVQVVFDHLGIPVITAQTREDAFFALGVVTARDRLFQMDLLRRRSAGRLAELFGQTMEKADRWHRVMGFTQVARSVLQRLPENQQSVLKAYANGVNQAINAISRTLRRLNHGRTAAEGFERLGGRPRKNRGRSRYPG